MVERSNTPLPYNWRHLTVKRLSTKGIATNRHQVFDVYRGKITNEKTALPILKAISQVKAEHKRKLLRLQKLKMKI